MRHEAAILVPAIDLRLDRASGSINLKTNKLFLVLELMAVITSCNWLVSLVRVFASAFACMVAEQLAHKVRIILYLSYITKNII